MPRKWEIPERWLIKRPYDSEHETAAARQGWTLNRHGIDDPDYDEKDGEPGNYVALALGEPTDGDGWYDLNRTEEGWQNLLQSVVLNDPVGIKGLAVLCHNAPNRYADYFNTLRKAIELYEATEGKPK